MSAHRGTGPHVTLVLGAGGPVGHAFHAGVLAALASGCGWDARAADVIIGTSAGAQVGALLRAGWDWRRLIRHATLLSPGRAHRPGPRRWPASLRYLRSVALRPWAVRAGPLLAALLPEGQHDSAHIRGLFQRLFADRWPWRPLWIPAVHIDTGARVVFGRDSAPLIDVGTAVSCSSAVPAMRRPVAIGSRRYVDGAIRSPTHADLVVPGDEERGSGHRVAVIVSPLSRFAPMRALLRWETELLVRRGIDVILFEPDREVTAAMGWNPLRHDVTAAVVETAYRSTCQRLRSGKGGLTVSRLLGR
jgi:NTE family protein